MRSNMVASLTALKTAMMTLSRLVEVTFYSPLRRLNAVRDSRSAWLIVHGSASRFSFIIAWIRPCSSGSKCRSRTRMLSTIAYVQSQQVASLYLVADPACEFRHVEVVGGFETSSSSVRSRCMSESGEGIGARSGETAGSRYAVTASISARESPVLATRRMGVVTGC